MVSPVYRASSTGDLLSHFIENQGEVLSVFTEEFCYSQKVKSHSTENIHSVFSKALHVFEEHESLFEKRSVVLNVQGAKGDKVFSMTSFVKLLPGNIK